ncbi:hypothetical protein HW561_11675 [Rhodobacteraceae bacterium B1Z28]|uniref:IrrE N-terminal-like domain-containing protein n=1 Tax=Ruegeria haliotis TaxID=2747601 RepID=A0ABX2PTF2_9RHOB|nr:hypothetical protein [Ruegeria haliotis]NVO56447.1 hypothetical protein [Ruegeria haliotis]
MIKAKKQSLTTPEAVSLFREMIGYRRHYCEDTEFFRMTDFWNWLADGDGDGEVKIKTYRTENEEDYKRKAGVVAFGERATLVVDEKLLENADTGCKLSNYMLAHEFAHLALDHHAQGAVVKNFKLYSTASGNANVPPTKEEYEANLAAVFFQCGIALLDPKLDALSLAHRANSDVSYVKKAVRMCRLEVFRDELKRQSYGIERVVL